jgi:hypothetical protein
MQTQTDGSTLDGALPAVSVVVPVRNDPERLRRCLESIEASRCRVVGDAGRHDRDISSSRRPAVLRLRPWEIDPGQLKCEALDDAGLLAVSG